MKIVPYDFQQAAVDSLWEYFKHHRVGNPLIAMPTGTGKSVIIAQFLYEIFSKYPNQKVLVVTHRKELIKQDYDELIGMWPEAPAGIYSSGLGRKELSESITFCGVNSVYKKADQLGLNHLVIIDEAHLLNPRKETMYQRLLQDLTTINPRLRVVGLTATYWRLGHGLLTENHIFNNICFNMTDIRSFNWLIDKGYLCPLIPLRTTTEIDLTGVGMVGGEFNLNQLQSACMRDEMSLRAVNEIVRHGQDRKHWMIFATGVEHTEEVVKILDDYYHIPAIAVHSKMKDAERDKRIADYKEGKYRVIVNNNLLTTGFNFKPIDLIGMIRPTESSALWVQMLGRGTRVSPGKANCLVLDFAHNTLRLGPINDPVIPIGKKGKSKGSAPVKVCPGCNAYLHASLRVCPHCGYVYPETVNFKDKASTRELIKRHEEVKLKPNEKYPVSFVTYHVHNKKGKPGSLKVTYFYGKGKVCNEYIIFEQSSYGKRLMTRWWMKRGKAPIPETAKEAHSRIEELLVPTHITVDENHQYTKILDYHFEGSIAPNTIKASAG